MIIWLTGSACSGLETINLINTPNGSIYSPGYPYQYDDNKNCQWLFVAPYLSKVLLYFTAFEVEDNSECLFDSVELFDGRDDSSARLSKSCGSSLPSPVYSSSSYMYMQFKSDSSVRDKGFVAHYRELSDSSGAFIKTMDSRTSLGTPKGQTWVSVCIGEEITMAETSLPQTVHLAAVIGALSMLTSEPTAKSNVKRTRMFVLSLSRHLHYIHYLVPERIENSCNLLLCTVATLMIQRLRPAPSVSVSKRFDSIQLYCICTRIMGPSM